MTLSDLEKTAKIDKQSLSVKIWKGQRNMQRQCSGYGKFADEKDFSNMFYEFFKQVRFIPGLRRMSDGWRWHEWWFEMPTARWLTEMDKDEVGEVKQEVSSRDAVMHSEMINGRLQRWNTSLVVDRKHRSPPSSPPRAVPSCPCQMRDAGNAKTGLENARES